MGQLHCGQNERISIHALLAESDAYGRINDISRLIFLSTLSLRRATQRQIEFERYSDISIHALLAESDERNHLFSGWICYFYPRSPCGERPGNASGIHTHWEFLSTLSLRRATAVADLSKWDIGISIHALLAESDDKPAQPAPAAVQFLSTLSLRRATKHFTGAKSHDPDFYPRSPCGERHIS